MWYITDYRAAAPISLKLSTATSTGGKSLLLPTPFAFKMALLDRVIQDAGLDTGKTLWPAIRAAQVAVIGPAQITVNNTFTRVLKLLRGKVESDPDTGLVPVMGRSIAFREYVFWHGDCRLAIDLPVSDDLLWQRWLTSINYIGKRGGFIQALAPPVVVEELPSDFAHLSRVPDELILDGTLQIMDDCAADLTFDQVDIYSSKSIRMGKDRILRHIVLPYRQVRSSRAYTLYERVA